MSAGEQSVFERNADKIGKGVGVVCVLLLVADVVYHVVGHKHVHFEFEAIPGFYALAGFISYVGLVLTAKKLRTWLRRDENYYGEAPLSEQEQPPREPREATPKRANATRSDSVEGTRGASPRGNGSVEPSQEEEE